MPEIIVTPAMFFSGISVVAAIALICVIWSNHRREKKDRLEKWLK